MVGIANRLKRGAIENLEFLQSRYKLLLSNENYIRAISTATADEANVETRLNLAKAAFAEVV
jgi:hypothetical protein